MVFEHHSVAACYSRVSLHERHRYRRSAHGDAGREQGVFAVMFVPLLLVILGIWGLALSVGGLYNRKIELHGMAKAVALAAANELDGTAAGISAALARAETTAAGFQYNYKNSFTWKNAAISFSTSPLRSAIWVDADTASATPAGLYYVRVDTTPLAAGTVTPILLGDLVTSQTAVEVIDRAVAGRKGIKVTPLGICAMSSDPGGTRGAELVQYGFRRGVSYDLMQLNSSGTSPENFVIDPKILPGDLASLPNTGAGTVEPFVCTGTMAIPRLTGGAIRVSRPFPLSSLVEQLNSRFDQYGTNRCSPNGAPPDLNIRHFKNDTAAPWMNPAQSLQTAAPSTTDGKLRTIADVGTPPSNTADKYGPLWSYAKPAKHLSYVSGKDEPPSGYSTFGTGDWGTLYQGVSNSGYPTALQGGSPYLAYVNSPGTNKKLAQENRRVLNVALLSCPVPAGADSSANVLAVGKFFMTIPATASSISAEFAGVLPARALGGEVGLFSW